MKVGNLPKIEDIKDEFSSIKFPNIANVHMYAMDLGMCARRIGYLEASRDRLKWDSPAYNKFNNCIKEYWKVYFIAMKAIHITGPDGDLFEDA
jgi:hypothetical protein